MTRLVILGHGTFSKDSFETLVPANTTLRFFADAGSKIMLPAKTVNGELLFDYEKVADALSNYTETEEPLGPGGVVYNMILTPVEPDEEQTAKELHAQGKWGGEMMVNGGP